jgi:hypothetical protein
LILIGLIDSLCGPGMLHVTNGDSVLAGFREGGIPGTYLAWRDVLHDGPVPQTASLEALSDVRAQVLSEFGGEGDYAGLRAELAERDRTLTAFREHDETVLWFEHDLYDQLQLLQILDCLSREDRDGARVSLIQIDRHPGVSPFFGLGQLSGRQLADLLPSRQPVSPVQFANGREAWSAFCAPDPRGLAALAQSSIEEMPFLSAALTRCLEEYPSARDGLSRTERQLLEAGASGARHRRDYYVASSSRESCPWGDLSVYARLDRLSFAPGPAVDRQGPDEFALNERGRRILAGEKDWFREAGRDAWIGGVHLDAGARRQWRWDGRTIVSIS